MRRLLVLLIAALLASATLGVPGPADAQRPPLPAERGKPRALFFGDSYFIGGGCSPDRTRDMAAIAGRRLGYRPVVRGGGGTGFASANPEYGLPDYLGQIADGALDVRHPALVVIEGGSNDVGRPIARIRKNAGRVLNIARHKYPHARLVLVGPMDPRDGYADSTPINNALRRVAKRHAVPYIDDQTWLQDKPGQLCSDYDHPTYAAHERLGRLLARALRRAGA